MVTSEPLRSIDRTSPVTTWFGYCLLARMDGLYVTLSGHGLVGFDIPDSNRSGEFYNEAIDCRDHVSSFHQRSLNDCVVSRRLVDYQKIGHYRNSVLSLTDCNR